MVYSTRRPLHQDAVGKYNSKFDNRPWRRTARSESPSTRSSNSSDQSKPVTKELNNPSTKSNGVVRNRIRSLSASPHRMHDVSKDLSTEDRQQRLRMRQIKANTTVQKNIAPTPPSPGGSSKVSLLIERFEHSQQPTPLKRVKIAHMDQEVFEVSNTLSVASSALTSQLTDKQYHFGNASQPNSPQKRRVPLRRVNANSPQKSTCSTLSERGKIAQRMHVQRKFVDAAMRQPNVYPLPPLQQQIMAYQEQGGRLQESPQSQQWQYRYMKHEDKPRHIVDTTGIQMQLIVDEEERLQRRFFRNMNRRQNLIELQEDNSVVSSITNPTCLKSENPRTDAPSSNSVSSVKDFISMLEQRTHTSPDPANSLPINLQNQSPPLMENSNTEGSNRNHAMHNKSLVQSIHTRMEARQQIKSTMETMMHSVQEVSCTDEARQQLQPILQARQKLLPRLEVASNFPSTSRSATPHAKEPSKQELSKPSSTQHVQTMPKAESPAMELRTTPTKQTRKHVQSTNELLSKMSAELMAVKTSTRIENSKYEASVPKRRRSPSPVSSMASTRVANNLALSSSIPTLHGDIPPPHSTPPPTRKFKEQLKAAVDRANDVQPQRADYKDENVAPNLIRGQASWKTRSFSRTNKDESNPSFKSSLKQPLASLSSKNRDAPIEDEILPKGFSDNHKKESEQMTERISPNRSKQELASGKAALRDNKETEKSSARVSPTWKSKAVSPETSSDNKKINPNYKFHDLNDEYSKENQPWSKAVFPKKSGLATKKAPRNVPTAQIPNSPAPSDEGSTNDGKFHDPFTEYCYKKMGRQKTAPVSQLQPHDEVEEEDEPPPLAQKSPGRSKDRAQDHGIREKVEMFEKGRDPIRTLSGNRRVLSRTSRPDETHDEKDLEANVQTAKHATKDSNYISFKNLQDSGNVEKVVSSLKPNLVQTDTSKGAQVPVSTSTLGDERSSLSLKKSRASKEQIGRSHHGQDGAQSDKDHKKVATTQGPSTKELIHTLEKNSVKDHKKVYAKDSALKETPSESGRPDDTDAVEVFLRKYISVEPVLKQNAETSTAGVSRGRDITAGVGRRKVSVSPSPPTAKEESVEVETEDDSIMPDQTGAIPMHIHSENTVSSNVKRVLPDRSQSQIGEKVAENLKPLTARFAPQHSVSPPIVRKSVGPPALRKSVSPPATRNTENAPMTHKSESPPPTRKSVTPIIQRISVSPLVTRNSLSPPTQRPSPTSDNPKAKVAQNGTLQKVKAACEAIESTTRKANQQKVNRKHIHKETKGKKRSGTGRKASYQKKVHVSDDDESNHSSRSSSHSRERRSSSGDEEVSIITTRITRTKNGKRIGVNISESGYGEVEVARIPTPTRERLYNLVTESASSMVSTNQEDLAKKDSSSKQKGKHQSVVNPQNHWTVEDKRWVSANNDEVKNESEKDHVVRGVQQRRREEKEHPWDKPGLKSSTKTIGGISAVSVNTAGDVPEDQVRDDIPSEISHSDTHLDSGQSVFSDLDNMTWSMADVQRQPMPVYRPPAISLSPNHQRQYNTSAALLPNMSHVMFDHSLLDKVPNDRQAYPPRTYGSVSPSSEALQNLIHGRPYRARAASMSPERSYIFGNFSGGIQQPRANLAVRPASSSPPRLSPTISSAFANIDLDAVAKMPPIRASGPTPPWAQAGDSDIHKSNKPKLRRFKFGQKPDKAGEEDHSSSKASSKNMFGFKLKKFSVKSNNS